jgi:hypothetical protein
VRLNAPSSCRCGVNGAKQDLRQKETRRFAPKVFASSLHVALRALHCNPQAPCLPDPLCPSNIAAAGYTACLLAALRRANCRKAGRTVRTMAWRSALSKNLQELRWAGKGCSSWTAGSSPLPALAAHCATPLCLHSQGTPLPDLQGQRGGQVRAADQTLLLPLCNIARRSCSLAAISSTPSPFRCAAQGLCAERVPGAEEGQPHLPHPCARVRRRGG